MKILSIAFVYAALAIATQAQWIKQTVNTTASFRGLSVVSEKVVWASGTGGTVIKTTDAGKSWTVMTVPGAEKLDFRDIEAFDANTAYILSIGNGDNSQIYKTTDGGATWKSQFANKNEKAFFDAIACWDKNNCIAMSDPVDGHYVLISTADGGTNWKQIVSNQMPAAKDGEAAFAASGSCLFISAGGTVYLVSGGTDARVFRSTDRGQTWSVATTPITRGTPGSGIFSIAMRDAKNGVIVGGNYEKPNEAKDNLAFTSDDGKSWTLGSGLSGFRSSVVYIYDARTLLAIGTNGSDISTDGGATWKKIGDENLNSVSAKGRNAVWSVGPNGNVFHLATTSALAKPITTPAPSGLPPSIRRLDLSHNEISSTCSSSGSKCSEKKHVAIRTVAVKWNGPHKYVYTVTAGKVVGEGSNVEWDLSGAAPGKYTITAAITIPYADRWGVLGRTETREVVVR